MYIVRTQGASTFSELMEMGVGEEGGVKMFARKGGGKAKWRKFV